MRFAIPRVTGVLLCLLVACKASAGEGGESKAALLQKQAEAAHGVAKVRILNQLSAVLADSDPAGSLQTAEQALALAQTGGLVAEEAEARHHRGIALRTLGRYDEAAKEIRQAASIWQRRGMEKELASAYNTLGLLEADRGNYEAAMETHMRALEIRKRIGDKQGLAYSYNNLGNMYRNTDNYPRALEFLQHSLKLKQEIGEKKSIAYSLNNIGHVYCKMGRFEEALDSYRQALEIRQRLNDRKGTADSLNSIGTVLAKTGQEESALAHYRQALELRQQGKDIRGIAETLIGLGQLYTQMGRTGEAMAALKKALKISRNLNGRVLLAETYKSLSAAEEARGNYRGALAWFRQFAVENDALYNERNSRRISELQARFEANRKEQEIALLQKEAALREAQLNRERTLRNSLATVLALTALLGALAVNRFRMKQASERRYRLKCAELDLKSRQLQQLNSELERSSSIKSRFLANVSHELRTPMNGVIGMANILLDTNLDPTQRRHAEIIRSSASGLLDLLNDLLDLSKIEADKLELHPEAFDLPALVNEVAALMEVAARDKGIVLRKVVDGSTPRYIRADRGRLRQILINLVGNAVKFTDKGHVELRLGVEEQSGSSLRLRFEVEDTGIGIPESKMPLLFQSFSQVDPSASRRYGGTGLGLAISRRLVEMMGGTMDVESEEGRGSTFRFSILVESAALPEAFPSKADGNGTSGRARDLTALLAGSNHSGRQLKILIAEDNAVNQLVTKTVVAKLGHEASIAANGEEALRMLQAEHFDLVLMDVQMPFLDGLQATQEIRAGKAGQHNRTIPIVAMTAQAMKGDREKCLAAGMDDYLSKPVQVSELAGAIARFSSPAGATETSSA